MSLKLNVTIREGNMEVDRRKNWPVRKRPDGTAGIVWRGLVYPLRADRSIDLTDEALDKEACPEHFRVAEDLICASRAPAGIVYFLERTKSRAYLAFDGPESSAVHVNREFAKLGLSGGYDESFRPARDGYFYDWFVRLKLAVTDDLVAGIMGRIPAVEEAGDVEKSDDVPILRMELPAGVSFGNPTEETDTLRRSLNAALAERDALHADVARLRHEMSSEALRFEAARNEIAELKTRLTELEAENRALRENRTSDVDREAWARADAEIVRLDTANGKLRNDLREAKETITFLEEENAARSNEISGLKEELRQAKYGAPLRARSGMSVRKEKKLIFAAVYEVFLPMIELTDEDRKNMLEGFSDPTSCFRTLRMISDGEQPPNSKSFKGVKGLWEVPRVGTGRPGCASNGRIYYRQSGERWDVGLHVKKDDEEQKRFVKKRFHS